MFVRRRIMMGNKGVSPADYLCFTALSASTISRTGTNTASLEYSADRMNWSTFDSNTTINLATGDSVYFRGSNTTLATGTSDYTNFVMTGSIEASGNIMSLLYPSDFDSQKTISGYNCFCRLFYGCTSLTTAPKLPATSIERSAYREMFYGCSALTSAPDLSQVTTLDSYVYSSCCQGMFQNCTSLTQASLPSATTGGGSCYRDMYNGCTSLVTAPYIALTSTKGNAFDGMFQGCTSLTTVQSKLLITTPQGQMCKNMFNGCSNLENTPELLSDNPPSYCYQNMFRSCAKVDYIKMLAQTLNTNATGDWVRGVASTGIFVKHIDATWTATGNNGVPTNWTVIYYDPEADKYYTDQTKSQECDDHGNPI